MWRLSSHSPFKFLQLAHYTQCIDANQALSLRLDKMMKISDLNLVGITSELEPGTFL